MVTGSCLCGTVRYEVGGPFHMMMSCHCSRCRKHHGSAFATYVSAPLTSFRWLAGEDAILSYTTASGAGARNSCRICGSTVPMTLPSHELALLPAGPLEGELGLHPQAHIFVGSKAPWYTITDALPQHEEYPPDFATPGLPTRTVEDKPGFTQGSCLCGKIAFEAEGPALFMQSCHCSRCRRARGAAHGTNIFFKSSQFRWTRGEELLVDYKVPEARYYGTSFCRECGSALPRVSKERDLVVIPAGCLDTDPPMRTQRHIFTNYKATWFEITEPVTQYPEGPPPA